MKQLAGALRGAEKLVNALKSGAFGCELLDDDDVAELEGSVARKAFESLQPKTNFFMNSLIKG